MTSQGTQCAICHDHPRMGSGDPIDVMLGGLRREIRCHLRADVNGYIRSFLDIDLIGMSGFYGHPRTLVAVGVGSSRRMNAASST